MAKKKDSRFWTEEQAHRVLDRADASGLSDERYAEKHGLHPKRLYWWRSKLGRGKRSRKKASRKKTRFVEVKASQVTTSTVVEVTLRNGRRVTLPLDADAAQLARLLDAVEGGPC